MADSITSRLGALASTVASADSEPQEHILCMLPFPEEAGKPAMDMLRKLFPNFTVSWKTTVPLTGDVMRTGDIPDDTFENVTVLVTLSTVPSPEAAKNIKFIHFLSAGVNHIEHTRLYNETDIPLTTSSGIHGPTISEWCVMQILSHARNQPQLLQWQKEHVWGKTYAMMNTRDCVGQRLGVLGYGSIGRQTARVCKAMGMDVIAYTASPKDTPESRRDDGYAPAGLGDPDGSIPSAWYSGLDKASLHNFLSQDIDCLVASVPLTEQTKHFLGAEEFEILGKRNAFVLNISRGGIIDQEALVVALKKDKAEGGLAGAALDVTDPEPLPADHPLWDAPNITITPHMSGLSSAYQIRSFEILARNLTLLQAGKPLMNVVDKKKGY